MKPRFRDLLTIMGVLFGLSAGSAWAGGAVTGVSTNVQSVMLGQALSATVTGTTTGQGCAVRVSLKYPDSPKPEVVHPHFLVEKFPATDFYLKPTKSGKVTVIADGGTTSPSGWPACTGKRETTVTVKVARLVLPPGMLGAKRPDLVCTVSAFKDLARTQPIAAGGSVGDAAKVYFVVSLQNTGTADVSKDFEARIRRRHDGKQVANPGFKITAPVTVGQTRIVGVIGVDVPAGTTKMEVTGQVDAKKEIGEANEENNACTLTMTASLGGAPPVAAPQVSFASTLYPIYVHERCVNCHGRVNTPLGTNHPTDSASCASCHSNPPNWTKATTSFWTGSAPISVADMCNEAKKKDAHRDHFLTKWAWAPTEPAKGDPPTKAPGTYNDFVQKWNAWAAAGKPCP